MVLPVEYFRIHLSHSIFLAKPIKRACARPGSTTKWKKKNTVRKKTKRRYVVKYRTALYGVVVESTERVERKLML